MGALLQQVWLQFTPAWEVSAKKLVADRAQTTENERGISAKKKYSSELDYLTISRASTKGVIDDAALGQLLTDKAGFARTEIESHAAQIQPIEIAYDRLLSLAATQKRTTDALLVALDEIKSEVSLLRRAFSESPRSHFLV